MIAVLFALNPQRPFQGCKTKDWFISERPSVCLYGTLFISEHSLIKIQLLTESGGKRNDCEKIIFITFKIGNNRVVENIFPDKKAMIYKNLIQKKKLLKVLFFVSFKFCL